MIGIGEFSHDLKLSVRLSRHGQSVSALELLDPDAVPPFIARLADRRNYGDVLAGVNDDDCAVLRVGESLVVVTTDFLNSRPIGVELGIAQPADLGRLLVLTNLSDLCGSGARPLAILVAVTMARGTSLAEFEQLMTGAVEQASLLGVPVVGGDTKLGPSTALLAVALGTANDESTLFLKNRAQATDDLWLSGNVGDCCAAVLALTSKNADDDLGGWARQAILRPVLPLRQSRELSELRVARGGIDISDGLGADLKRMCIASRVGANVLAERLPVGANVARVAASVGVPSYSLCLSIGGDVQFLATAPATKRQELAALGFVRIGEITTDSAITLTLPDGSLVPMPSSGHRDARAMSFSDEVRALIRDFRCES